KRKSSSRCLSRLHHGIKAASRKECGASRLGLLTIPFITGISALKMSSRRLVDGYFTPKYTTYFTPKYTSYFGGKYTTYVDRLRTLFGFPIQYFGAKYTTLL